MGVSVPQPAARHDKGEEKAVWVEISFRQGLWRHLVPLCPGRVPSSPATAPPQTLLSATEGLRSSVTFWRRRPLLTCNTFYLGDALGEVTSSPPLRDEDVQ